ncbi:hypothetical protein LRS11_16030 [Pseudomonas sp. J452]|uniref:hypothetical protein n=1 Tax=Pseudomonas sp. J452 TaxID=2898441 RepID=UPI0021AD91C9|nr:hypothetical protein [Pseudomonas sp. J452]UUY07322.1 hypothetical protein LRS11_16030 [Pseudomonas sp. J452]
MKGLRKLALSCCLVACSSAVSATEMAGNLLKPDLLVYSGIASLGLDQAVDRGRSDTRLPWVISTPMFSQSFLHEDAGRSFVLGRKESRLPPMRVRSADELASNEAAPVMFVKEAL